MTKHLYRANDQCVKEAFQEGKAVAIKLNEFFTQVFRRQQSSHSGAILYGRQIRASVSD